MIPAASDARTDARVHARARLSPLTPARRTLAAAAAPDIEIVVPVYNEAAGLERSIRRLHRFLSDGFPFSWRIVIADNAQRRRDAGDRARGSR